MCDLPLRWLGGFKPRQEIIFPGPCGGAAASSILLVSAVGHRQSVRITEVRVPITCKGVPLVCHVNRESVAAFLELSMRLSRDGGPLTFTIKKSRSSEMVGYEGPKRLFSLRPTPARILYWHVMENAIEADEDLRAHGAKRLSRPRPLDDASPTKKKSCTRSARYREEGATTSRLPLGPPSRIDAHGPVEVIEPLHTTIPPLQPSVVVKTTTFLLLSYSSSATAVSHLPNSTQCHMTRRNKT